MTFTTVSDSDIAARLLRSNIAKSIGSSDLGLEEGKGGSLK